VSSFTIINDITVELRHRIFTAMQTALGVDLGFTDESVNIALAPPEDVADTSTRLSLYLYHVGINNSMRNQNMLPQTARDDELRLPPLPLELRYLVTPTDDEEVSQLILGRLLQFIYDNPSLDTIGEVPLGNSFGGASRELRLTPDLLNVEQLSQLWNAFSQPFRLSLAFQVDVVAIDSARSPVIAPRVVDVLSVAGIKERI